LDFHLKWNFYFQVVWEPVLKYLRSMDVYLRPMWINLSQEIWRFKQVGIRVLGGWYLFVRNPLDNELLFNVPGLVLFSHELYSIIIRGKRKGLSLRDFSFGGWLFQVILRRVLVRHPRWGRLQLGGCHRGPRRGIWANTKLLW